jgi:N-acetylglutamate synthase-like GNAT family acetyltransferase
VLRVIEIVPAGLGSRLVDRAEAVAAARGIAELFLLTETAAEWFTRRGWDRPSSPAPAPSAPPSSASA